MGSTPRRRSKSPQQVLDCDSGPQTETPCLQDQPSLPYIASSSKYCPGGQCTASPPSRQSTSGAFAVETSQVFPLLGESGSHITPPRAAAVKATANGDRSNGGGHKPTLPASPAHGKSKRVRTGCLTCRERHLKCDERVPECNNCLKSNRECRRGVRLNFIDVQVKEPPCVPLVTEWTVQILDESRLVASEYKGGLGRYPSLTAAAATTDLNETFREQTRPVGSKVTNGSSPVVAINRVIPEVRNRHNPDNVGQPPPYALSDHGDINFHEAPSHPGTRPCSTFVTVAENGLELAPLAKDDTENNKSALQQQNLGNCHVLDINPSSTSPSPGTEPAFKKTCHGGYTTLNSQSDKPPGPMLRAMGPSRERSTGGKDYLSADEEIQFVQAFIDEVAVWMDSLTPGKHFANAVPYLALGSPMLLSALLACGAWQLMVAGEHTGEKADSYYDLAVTQLLHSQHEQNRDVSEHALTAVVLDAYHIMSDKPNPSIDHISFARALIRECQWDASSDGPGAACFWVNIGMEVLRCISFGWHTTLDPDQWGLDLEFITLIAGSRSASASVSGGDDISAVLFGRRAPSIDISSDHGNEELWLQRICYILAKVANFCFGTTVFQESSPHEEQVRLQSRYEECRRLQDMCNVWSSNCPRSMRPYGYSPGPSARSLFPNVWLIKTPAKLGRLFYHTAVYLLAESNPLDLPDRESRSSQLHHAHHVCGIAAHTSERAVCLVAIRCLAVVGTVLVDYRERNEALDILGRIRCETGWQVKKVVDDLKRAWGWEGEFLTRSTPPVVDTESGSAAHSFASLGWHVGSAPMREAVGERGRMKRS
ncbi:hypothetical protein VTK26DRAFT_974 [Humicola hyalothermophila]